MIKDLYESPVLWQMSPAERASFFYILDKTPNKSLAVEVGTYFGGSLQHLSTRFDQVISCDIDHRNVIGKYPNAELVTGNSKQTLPVLVDRLNREKADVGLFLIDANHEYSYVLSDLNAILDYKPTSQTVILIHDSWYPPSRQAICACTKLKENPYVHFVDTDFCKGVLIDNTYTLIGGFCLVIMKSEPRQGNLVIQQSSDYTYRVINAKVRD